VLYSGYQVYSNYDGYKTLIEIEKKYGESTLEENLPVDYKYFKAIVHLGVVGMAFAGISILASMLLLWSYFSRNPYLALPYFFWNIFMLLYTFGLTIFFIAIWNGFQYIFVISIVWWLLSMYLIIVVYSYIQTLRQDPSAFDEAPPGPAIVMNPPPYARFP